MIVLLLYWKIVKKDVNNVNGNVDSKFDQGQKFVQFKGVVPGCMANIESRF